MSKHKATNMITTCHILETDYYLHADLDKGNKNLVTNSDEKLTRFTWYMFCYGEILS